MWITLWKGWKETRKSGKSHMSFHISHRLFHLLKTLTKGFGQFTTSIECAMQEKFGPLAGAAGRTGAGQGRK